MNPIVPAIRDAADKFQVDLTKCFVVGDRELDVDGPIRCGELIERIDGDVTELATFFSQFALNLVSNGLLLIGILVALFLGVRVV